MTEEVEVFKSMSLKAEEWLEKSLGSPYQSQEMAQAGTTYAILQLGEELKKICGVLDDICTRLEDIDGAIRSK